jgi:osmotically-inducible protein OsmY
MSKHKRTHGLAVAAQSVTDEQWNTAPREIGHRGHGPKDYARSDARVYEDVCESLTRHDGVDARDVAVSVKDGEVTVEGTVATREMKQQTLHAVGDVLGVKHVTDALRVRQREDAS